MTTIADLTTDLTDAEVEQLAQTYARMHRSFSERDRRIAGWYWQLTCALADESSRREMQAHALTVAAGEVGALSDEDDEDLSGWICDTPPEAA